ncbi:MAG TPA: sigma-54-dependent Fis family transcriptional regulator [Thiotrichales bacterium]|nr:sigma-54-dependent Fis family transcriptional regulator [Thiotrichales bacterium]
MSKKLPPGCGAQPTCDQLIDIIPGPFVIIDRDYRILAANLEYRQRYCPDCEEIVGRHCYEVSHRSAVPCSHHGEHCPLEEVFTTGSSTQVMHVHYDNEGEEEHVQIQASPILDDDGNIACMGEFLQVIYNRHDRTQLLVGRSPVMMRMISLLQRVAPTRTTVLLQGESGVGKERVAEYLHQYSERSRGPFVVLDCSVLPENLIESELFGHEKGAFTGATGCKQGLFEAAHGGTLFIDEIGELPLPLQSKLLRALETGTIRRLGGTDAIQTDVRVIAATNRNLQHMVADGTFREDLYYRLSAFPVRVPPLREHKDDIPLLAEHFLEQAEEGPRHLPLTPEVIETLLGYDYPGNVRELRNIIERATILAYEDKLGPEHIVFESMGDDHPTPQATHLPSPAGGQAPPRPRRRGALNDQRVREALKRAGGHRQRAAALLGISERTLYRYIRRMREHGEGLGRDR